MSRAQLTSTVEQNTGGAVAPFLAGKNKIINGDFGVWQRGTSFSNPSLGQYTADRFVYYYANAYPTTFSVSQQSFTPGTAPVAGYEGKYFWRSTITTVGSTTAHQFQQPIEDVRTFAGQTVTVSFWAKADSARTVSWYINQYAGSGGTGGGVVNGGGAIFTLSTSWQRFSFTLALPSISGMTIGTGSYLGIIFAQACASGSVLDLWGVQVEAGSVATPFTTASGTLQGELALCQRYWFDTYNQGTAIGNATKLNAIQRNIDATQSYATLNVQFAQTMRIPPTVTIYSTGTGTAGYIRNDSGGTDVAATAINTGDTRTTLQVSGVSIPAGYLIAAHITANAEL